MSAGHEEAGATEELLEVITSDVDKRLASAEQRNAALVNQLSGRIGETDTQVREQLAELAEKVEETRKEVSTLHDLVTDLPAGGPWLWEALEPEDQRALWNELDAFVSWLQNRILCHNSSRLNWLPPCWYKHPDAVEQLTALMVAHKASYNPKMATASHSLVDWFHRCLWPTMEVIKARGTFKYCIEQREHKEVDPTGQMVPGSGGFTAFVDATVPETAETEMPTEPGSENPTAVEGDPGTGIPPWMVDPGTGEIIEPPESDEPPDPEGEPAHG